MIYQKRRTIGIYVTAGAEIEIRCPRGTPAEDIEKFARKHSGWAEEALAKKRAVIEEKEKFRIADTAVFLGETYPVKRIPEQKAGFNGEYFFMPEDMEPEDVKKYMIRIYKSAAERYIVKRTREIAGEIGLYPSKVGITSAKTRWGSCSGRNSLNFSWRLIMASRKAVDYVIIHELAHTAEHNHSRRFWDIVGKIMPDYKNAEAELKELAAKTARENWD